MKIGTRVVKTAIAVVITMYICKMLNLEPAVFGAISAVINMQPSIYLTFKTAREQVTTHILGVAIGLAAGYILGGSVPVIGAVTVLVIIIYNALKLQNGIVMGIVAAIFILGSPENQFLIHALDRTVVIFTGLISALAVNILLFPPRYRRDFIQKLRECNEKSVSYFCLAVSDFIGLDSESINVPSSAREEALRANEECRIYAEYYKREKKHFGDGYNFADPDDWFAVAEKFFNYSISLAGKADLIYELASERIGRRIAYGSPQISEEYKYMLSLLQTGCSTLERINSKLRGLICDGIFAEPENVSEELWEKLLKSIEKWQPKTDSSYYVHALIDISVMAREIRWLAREGKNILSTAAKFGVVYKNILEHGQAVHKP